METRLLARAPLPDVYLDLLQRSDFPDLRLGHALAIGIDLENLRPRGHGNGHAIRRSLAPALKPILQEPGQQVVHHRGAQGGPCEVLILLGPDCPSLETARELLGERMTMVGGTNALTLASGDPARIRDEVKRAVDVLGPTNRFILHPVDSLFPDTPWEGVEQMIAAWRECW
jgi:hypothetical protein